MGRKHACGLCMESDRLVGHVVDDDMAAVRLIRLPSPENITEIRGHEATQRNS